MKSPALAAALLAQAAPDAIHPGGQSHPGHRAFGVGRGDRMAAGRAPGRNYLAKLVGSYPF